MTFSKVKTHLLFWFVLAGFLMPIFFLYAAIEWMGSANGNSSGTSISGDGRYVAFSSTDPTVITGDTNGVSDILVYDRNTDTIERVSVSSAGVEGDSVSGDNGPTLISSDGRYVLFHSDATNLVAGDTNVASDVFVHDRDTDTTERVSVSSAGAEGDHYSYAFSISSDGRYVVFISFSTNLVVGDTNGASDVFVHDRDTDTTERVSVSSAAVQANGASSLPSISSDGRYVAFQSAATNLVASDTNGFSDAFVHDRDTDTTERVSVSSAAVQANGALNSISPVAISGDGRYVTFSSSASNLVAGDTNGASDVFVHDRDTDTTERVSIDDLGTQGNGSSVNPSISSDGSRIAFRSSASNLVAGDTNNTLDVFVYNRNTDTIRRVNVDDQGNESMGDGSFNDFLSISTTGQHVAFISSDSGLVVGSAGGVYVFIFNNPPTDITLSNDTLDENESAGFVIGGLTTTDADVADTHTYSFTCTVPGADDSFFSISGSNLQAVSAFDYESRASYSICIRTDDGNGGTFDENFTITVQDVGEGSTGSTPNDRDRGCTSDTALNYDPDAEVDDGSCLYPDDSVPGCTDPTATNFNASATTNNGSCTYNTPPTPVPGCTDSAATNFNAGATVSDGSCTYPPVLPPTSGCIDSLAINFNSAATSDDGSCVYPPTVTSGCLDPLANNYDPSVTTSDGSCVFDPNIPTDDPADPGGEGTRPFVDKQIQKAFKNPIPPPTQNTLVVTGLVLSISSLVIRIWNMIPILLGLRRRRRPWGTVYDSVTKQPLDPVYVTLQDASGNEAGQSITDLDGRYGFWVPPGLYSLLAGKSDYVFPSVKLAGKDHDDLYDNLYFGGSINVEREDEIINKNIPMDALNFNWNEFEKAKNKRLMKFFSKGELFLSRIGHVLFAAGFISSILLSYFEPRLLNHLVLGLYIAILALAIWGVRPKKPGFVVEKETGMPLSFGILSVYSALLQKEISHAVVGKTGRYYMLVQKGEYYLTLRKKTGENSYEEIFKSEPFSARKGYINKTLRV